MQSKLTTNRRKNKSLSIEIGNTTQRQPLKWASDHSQPSMELNNVQKKQQLMNGRFNCEIKHSSRVSINMSTPVSSTHHSRDPETKSSSQLVRDHSANSIISQLQFEVEEDEQQNDAHNQINYALSEDRMMIKICDGIYIGGEQSIWDIESMASNYITHLIAVDTGNQDTHKQSNYVPQIVSYIHSLHYDFYRTDVYGTLMETYKKIMSFIQHAQQQGESCIVICRNWTTQSNRGHLPNQNNANGRNDEFSRVYEPAAIVCGYLMFRYGWSMLKGLQFVSSRLTAGQKTAQLLHRVNNAKVGASSTNMNSHKHKDAYSGLIAHLVPELPHSTYTQCPNISAIPLSTLSLLQAQMVEAGRCLSYGWHSVEDNDEETVLTNTFRNCIMGSDYSQSYTNLLSNQAKSHQNLNKIQVKVNNSHRQSSKSIGLNKENQLSLGCSNAKNLKRLSVSNADHKKSNKSTIIQKKDSYQTNLHAQINETAQKQSIELKSNLKSKAFQNKKRINWIQNLIVHVPEPTSGGIRIQKQFTSSPLSKQALQYKENLKKSLINNENTKNDTLQLPKSYKIQSSDKSNANTIQSKNKIIVNVIQIISSKYKQAERNKTNNTKSEPRLLNKKTKIYKSRATLPTIREVLNNSNIVNQNEDHLSKCKTSPQMEQFEQQCETKSRSQNQLQPEISTPDQQQNKGNLSKVSMEALYSEGNQISHRKINITQHKPTKGQVRSSRSIDNKQNTQLSNQIIHDRCVRKKKEPFEELTTNSQIQKQKIIKATIENLKLLSSGSSGPSQRIKIKCGNAFKKSKIFQ